MSKYICLNNQLHVEESLSIVPIRYEDIFKIMEWRNQQIYHLRQNKILTKEDQENYFNNVIEGLFHKQNPSQIIFSYLEDGKCIGYGGLVNINWSDRRAEMSFLLDTSLKENKSNYSNYFSVFIKLIKKIAFNEIEINRVFTETYSFRTNHINILEENSFILEGSMKEHIYMQKESKYYDSILHGCLRKNYES